MSLGYYTHASPTLFNSGTNHMQMSSCFLLGTNDDLTDIATTWNSCAQISKWSGGIGLHVGNIRGKDSLINGTNGRSSGLVPFLKVFNDIARWIDQGGKRPGSIAIYLEPHHPDIFQFLDLRKNFGSETERARDLFLALWISDLFMKQVEADGDWYLLSADECPGLTDAYGDAYEQLYWKYVNESKHRKVVKARKLWIAILEAQIETGMPYISYKDAVNIKSNQKNLGTIKSSNLCNEINQYSDHKEYAVCNLASISLKAFVKPWIPSPDSKWIIYTKPNCKYCSYAKSYLTNNQIDFIDIPFNNETLIELKQKLNSVKITFPQIFVETNGLSQHIGGWSDLYKFTSATFDYDKLYDVAYLATINLNQVIDINYYPVPQTKYSNMRHRPIGLGIQGLADALVMMRIPFDSDEAVEFNEKYMNTIYLAAMTASNDMSIKRTNEMSILISYLNENQSKYPEYYSSDFVIPNSNINKLYHELKPNKWELSRDPYLTTIGSYSSFDGSPLSQGKFQFDLWGKQPEHIEKWNKLRESIIKYGTRNSLLTALMPTASTSQILGNNECFEFFTNNIYTRKTHAGDFILVNKYLVNDLISVNLWSPELKDRIIASNGSVQTIDEIPPEFKQIYKTIWEIKQIWVLKGAVARGPFVDQTQSMNIFMAEPDYQRLGSSHFWAWKNGLKTGMYYLRTKPSADAIKFTVDPKLAKMSIVPGSIKTTIKVASPTGNILSPRSNLKLSHPEEDSDFSFGGCENCSA
jgi:ribonucleoside-diphosphate reductase alpha subunit